MSKNNIPAGLSPEMVKQLIDNPGQTLGGIAGEAPTAFEPRTSTDISIRADKGVRPNIAGNDHDSSAERINRPSSKLADNLARGDEDRRASDKAQRDEHLQLMKDIDPVAMSKQLAFLARKMDKLQKEINTLKRNSNE